MAKVMKPKIDGYDDTDTGANYYDGPPPRPGIYKGKIKQLALAKIATGEHKGDDRLHLVVEITEGKYKGAGIVHSLNMIDERSNAYVNQFLRSMTDGSEEQFKGIRNAFWKVGYALDDPDDKKRLPILKIGKKFVPVGKEVSFQTNIRPDNNGNDRANIVRFLTPFVDNDEDEFDTQDSLDEVEDTEDTEYEESGMDEFAVPTTENPEPEGDSEDSDDSDDDDPWG